ncbi:MAG: UvrD-helicase domain-containing protein [Burkholderiales bacterium]
MFVVGDRMQSIYRFRQAEVGLFLQARHHGIGSVPLAPVTLSANFRSQDGLVTWCNQTFAQVMPDAEDLAGGAVPFVHSAAVQKALPGAAVSMHPQLTLDRAAEAAMVAQLVQSAQAENSGQTIAILVRSRTHLAEIVPRLKQACLRFQAIEIEELGHRPAVQDLLALTRALLHPADRIAWLSMLRAPWCGLTLADLDALAGHDHNAALWSLMQEEKILARLSSDGRRRLLRVRGVLNASLVQRRREPLRRAIEGAWLALGGPACVEDETDIEDAQVFFKLLEELDQGSDLADFETLHQRVSKLYALPDTQADARLQVMTIHKAKGLEFDTVIVPGQGYRPRREDPRLLLWLEHPRFVPPLSERERAGVRGESDLLLAPVREASQTEDPIYSYISFLDKAKGVNEDARLLYVAATRAKSRLHLFGHVKSAENLKPTSGSLLERLWPAVHGEFETAAQLPDNSLSPEPSLHLSPKGGEGVCLLSPWERIEVRVERDGVRAGQEQPVIRRLVSDWQPPAPHAGLVWQLKAETVYEERSPHDEVEFSWASETAKHAGTVAHRFLQMIAEEGLDKWNAARVESLRKVFARDLALLGVPESETQNAANRIAAALNQSLADERGRWVLGNHAEAQSELRLTGVIEGEIINVALDRTFVDEQGVRWIVDYKTGTHEGADVEGFLNREQERYRKQLEQYAALMRALDNRSVKLGLYFPLLKGWREWGFG